MVEESFLCKMWKANEFGSIDDSSGNWKKYMENN